MAWDSGFSSCPYMTRRAPGRLALGLLGEHGGLARLKHAVKAAQDGEGQDDLAVVGFPVIVSLEVSDGPEKGEEVRIGHRNGSGLAGKWFVGGASWWGGDQPAPLRRKAGGGRPIFGDGDGWRSESRATAPLPPEKTGLAKKPRFYWNRSMPMKHATSHHPASSHRILLGSGAAQRKGCGPCSSS